LSQDDLADRDEGMRNLPPRPNAFAPFKPDDFMLFLDARSIRTEHRTRGQSQDSDHFGGDHRRCGECRVLALGGLLAYAGRANANDWTRAEGLAELEAHPAAYDSMVKEGRRRERPAAGLLARPYDAAFGATYKKALTSADRADQLSVPVRAAQEFLGFAIEAVQDQSAVIEPGQMLPWGVLEDRLSAGPFALPRDLRAWWLWDEIVAACEQHPRADSMLEDHVFGRSAAASRQTAPHYASPDGGGVVNPIEAAVEADAIGSGHGSDDQVTTHEIAMRLVDRGTVDFAVAKAEAVRALAYRFGDRFDLDHDLALAEDIAWEAIAIARRDLAVRDAADILRDRPAASPEEATAVVAAALAEGGVEHPYDLDAESGREAHRRWLQVAARDAISMARRRRQAPRRR
jgi:hypothetical protein